MINSKEYKRNIEDLKARIRLLKDSIKHIQTLSKNKSPLNIKELKSISKDLRYCKALQKSIKSSTDINDFIKYYDNKGFLKWVLLSI